MGLAATAKQPFDRTWGWCMRHNQVWPVNQIPNILTLIRVFAPFTFWLSYNAYTNRGNTTEAIGYLLLTGLLASTDYWDGKAARSLGHVSKFGQLLDPVMDKVTGITGMVLFLSLTGKTSAPNIILAMAVFITLLMIAVELSLVLVATLSVGWMSWQKHHGRTIVAAESKLGANQYGKRKFMLEAMSLAAGYFLIYLTGPARGWLGPICYSVGMFWALNFGLLSLSQHVRDALEVRRQSQLS